ncbi:MAG TPA: T9SS type A sorting domain-containing protein, partial [Ferruginibacter sp.]|nr:T9SS type A sorting domain-containing protein [Ferruginibacter sp.]
TTSPGRRISAASWIGNNGNLWLFGGVGYTYLNNDLWKYTDNCTGPNCRPTSPSSSGNFMNENFQQRSNDLQIKKEEKIDLPNIHSLEIYNPAGQLLKKINSDLESYAILKNSRAGALMPGLYFIRVIYKDKSSKTLRKFLK